MLKFIIPAVVVALAAIGVGFALTASSTDTATGASSAENLKAIKLPADLPKLIDAGGGDATDAYIRAIELASNKADYLKGQSPDQAVVDELVGLITSAGPGASSTAGWADRFVKLAPGAQPHWNNAPAAIADAVLNDQVWSKIVGSEFTGDKGKAMNVIDAVFTFGWNMYNSNTRVLIRQTGITVMDKALALREVAFKDRNAARWRDALGSIGVRWTKKLDAMYKLDGSVADLVRFAELDEDLGFRVEATLRLGIAQWTKRTTGNKWAAENALKQLAASKTAIIAEAAKASQKITRQGVHDTY